MSIRIIAAAVRAIGDSPLTSPETSEPPSQKRAASKKRQRIDSDDEEARNSGKDELPAPASAVGRGRPVYDSEDEDGLSSVASHGLHDHGHEVVSNHSARERRRSLPPAVSEGLTRLHKKKSVTKSKGKAKTEGPPVKKKAKKAAAATFSDDFDVSDDFDESDGMEVESEELSDVSEGLDHRKSQAKAKATGRGAAAKGGGNRKGNKEMAVKAKNEGGRGRSGSAPLPQGQAKGSKATRTTAKRRASPPHDDMDIDVVGDDASNLLYADEANKAREETVPPPPKKKKLPTIKKMKISDLSGPPSTSPSVAGPSKFSSVSVANGGESKGKGALGEILPASSRIAAARMGATDLDLTNKNVYDQIFKAAGATSSGSNRRANEERRKELAALRNEWKVRREAEQVQTPPFDLQAQSEKLARFEEKLRLVRSAAIYPNAIAGKWRQLWDRERNRQKATQEDLFPATGAVGNREVTQRLGAPDLQQPAEPH